jgi:hypothetical protein
MRLLPMKMANVCVGMAGEVIRKRVVPTKKKCGCLGWKVSCYE